MKFGSSRFIGFREEELKLYVVILVTLLKVKE